MLVELERPFVWPEEPKEFDRYVVFFGYILGLVLGFALRYWSPKLWFGVCLLVLTGWRSWDQKTYKAVRKYQEEMQQSIHPDAKEKPTNERESIAEQAKLLLAGEERWKSSKDIWEDIGEAEEVETGVAWPKD
jgi:large subunit ribosomal protein L23